MERKNDFYIDYTNDRQIKWWNRAGCLLVTIDHYEEVVDIETDKVIGRFIWLKMDGPMNKYVTRKMNRYNGIEESN